MICPLFTYKVCVLMADARRGIGYVMAHGHGDMVRKVMESGDVLAVLGSVRSAA